MRGRVRSGPAVRDAARGRGRAGAARRGAAGADGRRRLGRRSSSSCPALAPGPVLGPVRGQRRPMPTRTAAGRRRRGRVHPAGERRLGRGRRRRADADPGAPGRPFGARWPASLPPRLATDEDGGVVTFVGRTRVTPGHPGPGPGGRGRRATRAAPSRAWSTRRSSRWRSASSARSRTRSPRGSAWSGWRSSTGPAPVPLARRRRGRRRRAAPGRRVPGRPLRDRRDQGPGPDLEGGAVRRRPRLDRRRRADRGPSRLRPDRRFGLPGYAATETVGLATVTGYAAFCPSASMSAMSCRARETREEGLDERSDQLAPSHRRSSALGGRPPHMQQGRSRLDQHGPSRCTFRGPRSPCPTSRLGRPPALPPGWQRRRARWRDSEPSHRRDCEQTLGGRRWFGRP